MDLVDLCSSSDDSLPDPFSGSENHLSNGNVNKMEFEGSDKSNNSFSENEQDEEGDCLILPMKKTGSFYDFIDVSTSGLTNKFNTESNDFMNVEKIQPDVSPNPPKLNYSSDTPEKKKKYTRKKKGAEENACEISKKNDRELKKIERLKNKEMKDKERALKKAGNENLRCLKPGECIKYVIPEISSYILQKPFSTKIVETLKDNGVTHKNEMPSIGPENSIGWIRKLPKYSVNENAKLSVTSDTSREPFLLVLYDMSEMEDLLKTKLLNVQIKELKNASCCQVTVLLYGSKAYFMQTKNGIKKIRENQLKISENDLDYYLTKLLFEEAISCFKAETPEELAHVILQFTKSIAEAPHKKQKQIIDEKADFFMRGDNKNCVKVDTAGNGLLQLWCQSLTKFPLTSLEKAHAICEKFNSPFVLMEKLREVSPEEGIKMLADIPVVRASGFCSSSRRIGPELARKICIYFTSIEGEQELI